MITSNAFGSVESLPAFLSLGEPPTFTTHPQDLFAAVGNNVTLTTALSGTQPINLQWYKDDNPIADANSSNLILTNLSLSNSGIYKLEATNEFGSIFSSEAVVSVGYPPAITREQGDIIAVAGTRVELNIQNTGTPPIIYQWYKNQNALADANSTNYILTSAQESDTGIYSVKLTNPYGQTESKPMTLDVGYAPAIITEPLSKVSVTDSNVTFTAEVNGTAPLNYQWYLGDNIINEATQKNYTLTKATRQNNGAYWVKVSNLFGNIDSRKASLSVGDAPIILTETGNQILPTGSNSTLEVTVSGDTPFTFQWFKNGQPITNANGNSLSLTNTQTTDSGDYHLVIKNEFGEASSRQISIAVGAFPLILAQPSSVQAAENKNVLFGLKATGAMPMQYTWHKDGEAMTEVETFAIEAYLVEHATANRKWLRQTGGGWVYVTPEGKFVRQGKSVDMNASVWSNPEQLVGYNFVLISNTSLSTEGTYHCVVQNIIGHRKSIAATFQLRAPPKISAQPQNTTITKDGNGSLSVTATGGNITYQWVKDGNQTLVGKTQASMVVSEAKESDIGSYHCIVSNNHGSVASDPAQLIVEVPPRITVHPADQNATIDKVILLSVQAQGVGTLQYQWEKDGVELTAGSSGLMFSEYVSEYDTSRRKWLRDAEGRMCFIDNRGVVFLLGRGYRFGMDYWLNPNLLIGPNFLSINGLKASDSGTYTCKVSSEYGSASSNGAAIQILSPPEITGHPEDVTIEGGTNASLTVTATGTNIQYAWKKDGQPISGATSATLQISGATADDAGQYTCTVSNDYGSVSSQAATVKVKILPVIVTHPVNINSAAGLDVIFKVTATSLTPLTYTWHKNNQPVTDGGGLQIVKHFSQYDSVNRKWLKDAQGNWCLLNSMGVLVKDGKSIRFGVAYWNNPNLFIGHNFLPIRNVNAEDAGSYQCVVSNEFGNQASTAGTLAIVVPPRITGQPQSATISQNQSTTLTVTAEGDNLQYQWYKDSVLLTNKTNASLALENAQATDSGLYSCKVSNANGAATSQPAEVTVITTPTIVMHPADANATTGSHPALVSRATGGGQLALTWQSSNDGTNWSNVNGAQPFVIASQFAQYDKASRKWLKDADGSWCYITPQGLLVRGGKRMQLNESFFTNPDLLVGATILPFANVQSSDSGQYRLKASNIAGDVFSNPASLTVGN